MAATAFDTLQAARDIEAAGLERAQAEAIAQAIQQRGADYATKADLEALKGQVWKAAFAAAGIVLAGVGVMLAIFA